MTHSSSINSPWADPHISMCVNLCPNGKSPELSLKKSRQLGFHELLGSTSKEGTKNSKMLLALPGRGGSPRFHELGGGVCPGRVRDQQHLSTTCSQQVLQSVMKSAAAAQTEKPSLPCFTPPPQKNITKTPASLLIQMFHFLYSMG